MYLFGSTSLLCTIGLQRDPESGLGYSTIVKTVENQKSDRSIYNQPKYHNLHNRNPMIQFLFFSKEEKKYQDLLEKNKCRRVPCIVNNHFFTVPTLLLFEIIITINRTVI